MTKKEITNAAIAAEMQKLQNSGKYHPRFFNDKFYKAEVTGLMQGIEGDPITNGISPEALCIASARQSSDLSDTAKANTNIKGLIYSMLTNQHLNVFDTVDIIFQITSPAIVFDHLIRHLTITSTYSPKAQRFSQRYSTKIKGIAEMELRYSAQGGNRQGSGEAISPDTETGGFYYDKIKKQMETCYQLYLEQIEIGISPETARNVLPNSSTLTSYTLKASLRTWITVLSERLHKDAQKETRFTANLIKAAFIELCPIISSYFQNFEFAEEIKLTDWIAIEMLKKTYPTAINTTELFVKLCKENE